MSVVDKLIFNCLVQYGNVALPSVGSLQVVGAPKRVEFSNNIQSNHIPVTDIIAEQGNLSAEKAMALYNDWLMAAKGNDGSVKVEGVGVILPQSFHMAEELRLALGLNEVAGVAPLRRRCSCGWIWWVLAVVAAAIVIVLLSQPREAEQPVIYVEESVAEENDAVVIPAPVVVEPAPQPAKPKITAPAADKRYNVIVGVFTIKYNARACAKQDPLGIGAENYTITPYPSGLWAVIAYSTNNLNDAERMRKEFKKIQSDVWVYRRW